MTILAEILEQKRRELAAWDEAREGERSSPSNERRLTNIGTFRAYVEAYLRHHSMIQQDLTLMVRQLAPSDHGLPLEIYVFSADKRWVNYEAIQADIFDHLLAAVNCQLLPVRGLVNLALHEACFDRGQGAALFVDRCQHRASFSLDCRCPLFDGV